ncbi:hypothetical protein CPB83DRAFT_849586 [Crepidotus variabilis]|uniref:Uncharacterized protein n=1 Tax=Crepidotus variabilis TaxID=179855 RepID=A0A9P6EK37_9AGAR|nr:hypothetical protein CPB83DRAFT_849586 [Crepidotus variabilis]
MEVRRKLEDAKALLSALGPRGEALVSHLDAQDAMSEPQAGESPTPADPVPMGSFGQTSFWGCSSPAEPCPVPAANDEVPPADMSWGGPGNTPTIDEPPVDLWGRGIPKKKKGKRKEAFGLWGASSCHEPSPQVERLSTHPTDELFFGGHSKASSSPPLLSAFPSPPTSPAPSVYSRSSTPELKNINLAFATPQGSQILFQNLQTLSATGSTEMISDLVNVIHSTSMKSISITFFTPEVQTIHPSAVVRLAICKWFGSISQVTIEAENSSFPPSRSTLPKAVFKKLLLAPLIRCLDLKGWKIEELDASLAALSRLESSKLEHLSLPFHSEAPGISLTRLGFIADSCPSLLSLKCRLKHLSNVPTTSEWSSSNTRNYNFSNLTVGNVDAHPKIDRALDIARYIDRLFPAINTLKTPDGPGQNAEQWELIGKIVKMLQEVRLEKL